MSLGFIGIDTANGGSEVVSGTFQFLIRRSPNAGPPEVLSFGELAYSDADGALHVGRFDGSILSGFLAPAPNPAISDVTGLQSTLDDLDARITALEGS